MDGLNDLHPPQGPGQWEAQQQNRLTALEEMMQRMSQALERLSLLAVPTPSTTSQPPAPTPTPALALQPLPLTRSAKVSPPDMYTGDRHKLYLYLSKC